MKYLMVTICLLIGQSALSQTKQAAATSNADSLIESFRCERSADGLSDLKMKMIENCNLNKPFSSSHSSAVKDTYMYCCHKK